MRLEARDVSESSLLLEFPDATPADANRTAIAIADRLRRERIRGVLDAVPGARTLFVLFDPAALDRRTLRRRLRGAVEDARRVHAPRETRLFRLPVAYGGDAGPDLVGLARERGISPEELARRHSATEYRVSFLGFSPGFAYLTGLPEELRAPRRGSPRPRVPAGSVGIGGEYTAVYPSETPAGWHLVGRCPAMLFDPDGDPPALLAPGDRVRFEPIGEGELARRLEQRSREEAASRLADAGAARDVVFEVLAPGLWTSIQGAPRFGLGSSGVPAGGAMDPGALDRANSALGNHPGAAGLEMTLSGPQLLVRRATTVCVAGADLDARWNGREVALDTLIEVREGDVLAFGHARRGARAYLGVRGGLEGRRPAEPSRRLAKGDLVAAAATPAPAGKRGLSPVSGNRGLSPVSAPALGDEGAVRVLPGPQADAFSAEAAAVLFSSAYRVSPDGDRRGIRLEGPPIPSATAADVPPEGTALGAIQVPANGQPIVLGPDRPVTGGYVKIGTVAARDWPRLAQAPPGAMVRFRPARLAEVVGEVD